MSKVNKPPLSLSRLIRYTKGKVLSSLSYPIRFCLVAEKTIENAFCLVSKLYSLMLNVG
jgi:hypothetical protein